MEVHEVVPDGGAASAGLEQGDIIVALAGRLVTSIDDLHRLLMTVPPDQGFDLSVVRGQALRTIHVPAAIL